jgi:hypothetical protein
MNDSEGFMKPFFVRLSFSWACRSLCTFVTTLGLSLITGCGGSVSSTTTAPPGNTTVTVLATSTANDQIADFNLNFNTITLTSKAGTTVSLLPAPEHVEFTHLNGTAEPLFTATILDGTYTAATATIGPSSFTCLGGLSTGQGVTAIFAYGNTPNSDVTINLPSAITVSGASMVLSLDMLVSQSASWSGANCLATEPFSITPTFNLTAASSTGFSGSANGKMSGLGGIVASVDASGNSLTLNAADGPETGVTPSGSTVSYGGPVWQVGADSNTVFQGISGLSALAEGMWVDFDGTPRPDGTLVATRIAVYDTNTTTLSVSDGPLELVMDDPALIPPLISASAHLGSGILVTGAPPVDVAGGVQDMSYVNAIFQISSQFANLQQLPFPASFSAANMVGGQTILVTSHATEDTSPLYFPASTITLVPQTINGTVTAVSSESGYDVYTVSLAVYDLFPQDAALKDQTTELSNPSVVVIYADTDTQLLNTQPIAVGSVVRFNGLIFNDSGTLRMDCAQISDGVAE